MCEYREGVDYLVKVVPFPSQAAGGCAISNGDGTFTIFINSRCSYERQTKALRHELEHLAREHFFRDEPIVVIESEANGKRIPSRVIPLFHSLSSLKNYSIKKGLLPEAR